MSKVKVKILKLKFYFLNKIKTCIFGGIVKRKKNVKSESIERDRE